MQLQAWCQTDWSPVVMSEATVQAVYNVASEDEERLFLFFDPVHKSTAIIIPELVTKAVQRAQVSADTLFSESELFGWLTTWQVSLPGASPLESVIERVMTTEAQAVIATDETDWPTGVFLPRSAFTAAAAYIRQVHHSDTTGLERLIGAGAYDIALDWIRRTYGPISTAHFSYQAVDLYVCENTGIEHLVDQIPCPEHETARWRPTRARGHP